jgi:hypothetical protein
LPSSAVSSDARAKAALSLFEGAGLVIDLLDDHHWCIMPAVALIQPPDDAYKYLYWPATGYWKRPDGSPGAGGALRLIREVQKTPIVKNISPTRDL